MVSSRITVLAAAACTGFPSVAAVKVSVTPHQQHRPDPRSLGRHTDSDDVTLDLGSALGNAARSGVNIGAALGKRVFDMDTADAERVAANKGRTAVVTTDADGENLQELITHNTQEPKGLLYTLELLDSESGSNFTVERPAGCTEIDGAPHFTLKCLWHVEKPFDFAVYQKLIPVHGFEARATITEDLKTIMADKMLNFWAPPPFHSKCPICGYECNVVVGTMRQRRQPLVKKCGAQAELQQSFTPASIMDFNTLMMVPPLMIDQTMKFEHGKGGKGKGGLIADFKVTWQIGLMKNIKAALSGN